MAHFGSGVGKSFFTSLAALFLVAFLAITTGPLTGLSTHLSSKQQPSLVGHVAEVSSRAARSLHTNSTLLRKRVVVGTYADRKAKGEWLSCRLTNTIANAQAANRGIPLESTIINPQIWATEGWEETEDDNYPVFKNTLNDAFTALHIDSTTAVMKHYQNEEPGLLFPANGGPAVPTQPTTARFENVFYPAAGAIVADANNSPGGFTTDPFMPYDVNNPNRFPDEPAISQIYQWSDAAFLQWKQVCQGTTPPTPLTNINFIFRAGIDNADTRAQIIYALQDLKLTSLGGTYATATTWTKDDNPDQFHALLGSKNGSGSAFLLITHKGPLGVKDITSVTVWHPAGAVGIPANLDPLNADLSGFKPTMVFTVVDVAEPV
ncbi:hypothetical protein N431DRAFT_470048 [Stipitochalara longipes BDJ]|nr:hypothetical protein N431DRAFT_470048 [Stipitochalara longipes BDJ]